jgi:Protein of unknown function (DUF3313)
MNGYGCVMKPIAILLAVSMMTSAVGAGAAALGDVAGSGSDGLEKVKITGLDTVYARPHTDLSGYNKIMLDPTEVSFRKNWHPELSNEQLTAADRQKISKNLAAIIRERLGKALASSGRYALVDAPGDKVLRIKADIRDLYIVAPDVPTTGITRNYAYSAGEMQLQAELRDASTGTLLARVIDRKTDPNSTWIRWTTRVTNTAAAERAIDDWIRILLRQLEAAHSTGTPS